MSSSTAVLSMKMHVNPLIVGWKPGGYSRAVTPGNRVIALKSM